MTQAYTQTPLVSVVVPMYNVEATLARCLDSLEAQTLAELEVVCVNDGSTDGSLQLARAYAAHDPRVRVVDKPNGGYGSAMNRGLAEARGTWVAIVEPDDVVEPWFYEELAACAEALGGAGAVDVVKSSYLRVFPGTSGSGPAGRSHERRVACPYAGRVRPKAQPFAAGDGAELLLHHPAIWAGMYSSAYLEQRSIRFVEAAGAGWADNPFMAATLLCTDRIAYVDKPGYLYYERDLGEAGSFAAAHPLVPLTRWNEMMDVAAVAQVDDQRALEALAVRGVNYALITAESAGLEDAHVRALAEESMARLDSDLVLGSKLISPSGKKLFCELTGLPAPKGGRASWYARLAGEAFYRVRTNGLGFALETARARKGGRIS